MKNKNTFRARKNRKGHAHEGTLPTRPGASKIIREGKQNKHRDKPLRRRSLFKRIMQRIRRKLS